MEIVEGQIIEETEYGYTVYVPYRNHERALLRRFERVLVGLVDGRTISPDQRRKAYAIMGEISAWLAEVPEFVKRQLKLEFMVDRIERLSGMIFSLSDCDMTLAREFITYLIDFCIEHEIPTKEPLFALCEDIEKYVYQCLMRKQCAVCGKRRADLHHYDQVGMGNDRNEIVHVGMRVISLCREHHTTAHANGKTWITEEMHLRPIDLTPEIGKVYGMTKKQLGG